jgi:hypothetical protein
MEEGGSYLDLHYSVNMIRDEQADDTLSTALPRLQVYVDNVLVTDFVPPSGDDQYIRIEIPANVINEKNNNQHRISFVYLNIRDCIEDVEYILDVHADSTLTFAYYETEPEIKIIAMYVEIIFKFIFLFNKSVFTIR